MNETTLKSLLAQAWTKRGAEEYDYSNKLLQNVVLSNSEFNKLDMASAYECLCLNFEDLGDLESALENAIKCYELRLNSLGVEHSLMIDSFNNLGKIYFKKADIQNSLNYFESSLNLCNLLFHANAVNKYYMDTYYNLGLIYQKLGKSILSEESLKKALHISSMLNAKEGQQSTANIYSALGNQQLQMGNLKESLEFHQKAFSIRIEIFGEKNTKIASSYQQIALVYQNEGNLEKAQELFEKSLDIRLKIFGLKHPATATVMNLLGSVYEEKGLLDLAYDKKKKALEIRQETIGEEHPDFAISLIHFANLLEKMCNFPTALDYLKKAVVILTKHYGNFNKALIMPYFSLSKIYKELGDMEKAEEIAEILMKLAQEFFGENHPQTGQIIGLLGSLNEEKENYPQAINFYRKSLKIQLKFFEENHSSVMNIYESLAGCLWKTGELEKALEIYEKILILKKKKIGENSEELGKLYLDIASINLELKGLDDVKYTKENLENAYALTVGKQNPCENLEEDEKFNLIYVNFINNLGVLLERIDLCQKALKAYQAALDLMQSNGFTEHVLTASILNNLALCSFKLLKNNEIALDYLLKALKIRINLGEENDIEAANVHHNIAMIYKNQKKFNDCISHHQKALSLREKIIGEKHPDTQFSLKCLEEIYKETNNFEMRNKILERLEKLNNP